MENKKEITSGQYAEKILEIAYHDFPLVHPKETVLKITNALLLEFAKQYHSSNDSVEKIILEGDLHPHRIETIIFNNLRLHEDGHLSGVDIIAKTFYDLLLPHLQKQQESDAWISVEDRLPEPNKRVLALCESGDKVIIWVDGETNELDNYMLLKDNDKYTHWMPLPKSPTIQIKQ